MACPAADESARIDIERSVAFLPNDDVTKIVPARILARHRHDADPGRIEPHVTGSIGQCSAIENGQASSTVHTDFEINAAINECGV